MREAVIHLLLTGLSVVLVSKVLPGIRVRSYGSAVAFALVVAVLNAVAWYLLAPLTWTFTFLTLGVGALLVNAFIFILADKVIDGVAIDGFITAIFASLGVNFVNWAMHFVLGRWAP